MFPVRAINRAILPALWRDPSLGLQEDALPVFQGGNLQTIEAAGLKVVGIPKGGDGHHLLGAASSREEAAVIATILRLFNPN